MTGVLLLLLIIPIGILIFLFSKISSNWSEINNNKAKHSGDLVQYQDNYRKLVESHKQELNTVIGNVVHSIPLTEDAQNTFVAKTAENQIVIYKDIPPTKPQEGDVYSRGVPRPPRAGSYKILEKINIDSVLFWAEKGSLQYTTTSTGNGTQVFTNALKGAVVAGTAGAVIGGLGTLGAQSQTVTNDTRKIIVKMKNAAEQEFPFYYQKAFIACMPEKEYEFLKMSNELN